MINDLIETSCLLVRSEQKEIVISSLNLLKILCTIFTQTTLAQYLPRICETVHNLHEKRSNPASASQTASTNNNYFNNLPPVSKSQQIRSFVKLILKKLIKKFSYEIIREKLFKNELANLDMGAEMDMVSGEAKTTGRSLTGAVKQGLENLLVNLKKSIEKDKKRKADEQSNAKKKENTDNVDLISMYTTQTNKTGVTNNNE